MGSRSRFDIEIAALFQDLKAYNLGAIKIGRVNPDKNTTRTRAVEAPGYE